MGPNPEDSHKRTYISRWDSINPRNPTAECERMLLGEQKREGRGGGGGGGGGGIDMGRKINFFFLPSVFICQYKLVINLRKHPLCTFPINIHPCVRGRFISSTARIPISRVHNFDLCPDKLKNIEKHRRGKEGQREKNNAT